MNIKFDSDLSELHSIFDLMHEAQKAYLDEVCTERLILRKNTVKDWVSTVYSILLKGTQEEIGYVTLIYDGEIWYKIYNEEHRNRGYITEAVSKLIEISTRTYFFLSIESTNKASRRVAKKLGFKYKRKAEKSLVFEKKKD